MGKRYLIIIRLIACALSISLIAGCAGTTIRVSVATNGMQGNSSSSKSSVSGDGRYVAFDSSASNLVPSDTNGVSDIFVRDTQTGQTTRVSVDSSQRQSDAESYAPFISANGRFVAFSSAASNLVPGDTNADSLGKYETFVHDRQTGETVRVNVDSAGVQGNTGDSSATQPSLSWDGRFVAFTSFASNLVTDDTNNTTDVFVHDLRTGQTTRISVNSNGSEGNRWSDTPSISGDGRYVTFRSGADNLVPGDTNNVCDMNGDSVANENCPDVFVHDRLTRETTRVSVNSSGVEGNGESYAGTSGMSISADGRYVAFNSEASNLVPGDTNNIRDFFVHDRVTGATQRVSVDSNGNQAPSAVYSGASIAINSNGQFVAFAFDGPLVADDTATTTPDTDIYVRDLKRRKTTMVSVSSAGDEAIRPSADPAISADGGFVTFFTISDNLVANDTNNAQDVFRRKRKSKLECACTY